MLAGLASQLGRPTGLRGRLIGNMLNRAAELVGLALRDDKRSGQGAGAAHLLVFARSS